MVYMGADNGMSDQSYVDLQEMLRVGSTPDVNIVVQVDHPASDSWPGARRLRIEKGQPVLLEELGALDMADPGTLRDFAQFARDHYPAENYALVIWDHGSGWQAGEEGFKGSGVRGQGTPNPEPRTPAGGRRRVQGVRGQGSGNPEPRTPNPEPRTANPLSRDGSLLYDQSSGHAMSVAGGDLKKALTEMHQALGRNASILAFDACLMQMLEVMYEAKDAADIGVGTEDLMPFNGFPYEEFLSLLVSQPTLSPRAYAAALPQLFVNSYNQGSQGDEDVTLSALDLTRLGPAVQALNARLRANIGLATSAGFHTARQTCQTFSAEDVPPLPGDDEVDLLDFLSKAPWQSGVTGKTGSPEDLFQKAVLACAGRGIMAPARGIAVWFPDNYLALKFNFVDYRNLTFSRDCGWLYFLDCFFSADDIKPLPVTQVELQSNRIGGHNDFHLKWPASYDMAPVSYEVREISSPAVIFDDPAENLDQWFADGFTLTSERAWSGNYSFYSGVGDNLENKLTLAAPLRLAHGGLLSFFAWYNTNETMDTTGRMHRDICYLEGSADPTAWTVLDSLYGENGGWQECRYYLPDTSAYWLRFRFKTGDGSHVTGVYIDNIQVQAFGDWRPVTPAAGTRDSSYYVFDALRDTFYYAVTPRDSFGNTGFVSPLLRVAVPKYAEPYSLPAPITGPSAVLVCDYPSDETPDILIYTLSGELVATLPHVTTQRVPWNVMNDKNKPLAAGFYLVVVKGSKFKSIGRIAVVH
jgi:hypothetical protein